MLLLFLWIFVRNYIGQISGDRNNQHDRGSGSSLISNSRPQTPPVGHRNSSKTKVTSGSRRGADRQITHLVPKHSPLHASPNPNYPSPGHPKSPKREKDVSASNEPHNQSTLASLPMIGIDDFSDMSANSSAQIHVEKSPNIHISDVENGVEEMSDSSSSSSSSDSDSDNDNLNNTVVYKNSSSTNGHMNGSPNNSANSKLPSMPAHILNEDLRLSESGSDSD